MTRGDMTRERGRWAESGDGAGGGGKETVGVEGRSRGKGGPEG